MKRPTDRPFALAAAVCLAAWLAAAAGCGYRLRGTGSGLPPGIKTLCVPMFRNQTTRYELDVKLTRAVINELVARGRVRIGDDAAAADAVLTGEITGFQANPIGFSGANQADKYNITVTARVTLKGRNAAEPLFDNPGFVYQQEYDVPPGSSFESVQTEALDKIAGRFARSLVVSILEGF
ncbi:MAG TPA: LptE family protein [Candidatus Aminicenantes bacterium]|nr:LptE family protein [Candidatus Aminicenantes bacterium]HRY64322.1 LptE family protein [Candidatus Aminicenantes bacterium]HRZ71235.1 LptE family protein [Candidatus Aminicenantes bacterium]